MSPEIKELYRALPGVDALLAREEVRPLIEQYGRTTLLRACREAVESARQQIRDEGSAPPDLLPLIRARLHAIVTPTLRPLINGTGIIVHTNLGRAPLSDNALAAMAAVGQGYSNLEFDMEEGTRGSRYEHVGALLAELTGAEAGLVVNNNAAALFLTLATLAARREVIVSRAHLVEVGGGFRIPDIMRQSGASLREVGTTNRTYLRDFLDAVNEQTALFLRVHTSNFRIEGFVHQPSLSDLSEAAHARGVLVVEDAGSGALLDTTDFGLSGEPVVQESIARGADLVLFSGDKLLGGPQAGCIVGRAAAVEPLKEHPLARVVRVDKTTLAALDATLRSYQRGEALNEIPLWRMIAMKAEQIRERAEGWADHLRSSGIESEVLRGVSAVGGGSLPGETLPTWLLALPSAHAARWAAALRAYETPVIARIEQDRLILDPRTVLPGQDSILIEALLATKARQRG